MSFANKFSFASSCKRIDAAKNGFSFVISYKVGSFSSDLNPPYKERIFGINSAESVAVGRI